LVLNTLDSFAEAQHDYVSASSVGRPLRVELPDAATEVDLQEPGGGRRTLAAQGGELVFTPLHAGFHTLRWEGGERTLAVNLPESAERELAPRAARTLAGAELARPTFAAAAWPQKPWALLALAALLLLLLEWLTYHLRVTV
jgi:hypothetical protein